MTQAIRVVSRIQDQDDVDNVAPSDGVILVGDGDKFITDALEHAIGGDRHSASTLAELNSKISDAALIDTDDSRLSDSREWTADTVSQAEAEAGTATTRRAWTAQRVAQAIASLASVAWTQLTGTLTLSQLNDAVSDATLDDSSAARTPTAHAGTHATAGNDPIAPADIGAVPLIDPATPGNLVTVTPGGTLQDAGYAADEEATPRSVVQRTAQGAVRNVLNSDTDIAGIFSNDNVDGTGVTISGGQFGLIASSSFGPGVFSESLSGLYNARFASVSAIERLTGVLRFLGSSAAGNRLAQLNEINGVAYVAQSLDAGEQAQARTNIDAEEAGAASAVQSNLDTHVGAAGVGVHGAGATGAELLAAGDEDEARAALGFAPIALPRRPVDHFAAYSYTLADVVSGGEVEKGPTVITARSSTTAGSRARGYVNSSALRLNAPSGHFADWTRPIAFNIYLRSILSTSADGFFRLFFGRQPTESFGSFAGNFVALEMNQGAIKKLIVCRANVVEEIPVSISVGLGGAAVSIFSNNGAVNFFNNGILVGSATAGPNTAASGTISAEVTNGTAAVSEWWQFLSWSE